MADAPHTLQAPRLVAGYNADGESIVLAITDDGEFKVAGIPLTYETDSVTVLETISRKLDILIKYEALFHGVDFSEDTTDGT